MHALAESAVREFLIKQKDTEDADPSFSGMQKMP